MSTLRAPAFLSSISRLSLLSVLARTSPALPSPAHHLCTLLCLSSHFQGDGGDEPKAPIPEMP